MNGLGQCYTCPIMRTKLGVESVYLWPYTVCIRVPFRLGTIFCHGFFPKTNEFCHLWSWSLWSRSCTYAATIRVWLSLLLSSRCSFSNNYSSLWYLNTPGRAFRDIHRDLIFPCILYGVIATRHFLYCLESAIIYRPQHIFRRAYLHNHKGYDHRPCAST